MSTLAVCARLRASLQLWLAIKQSEGGLLWRPGAFALWCVCIIQRMTLVWYTPSWCCHTPALICLCGCAISHCTTWHMDYHPCTLDGSSSMFGICQALPACRASKSALIVIGLLHILCVQLWVFFICPLNCESCTNQKPSWMSSMATGTHLQAAKCQTLRHTWAQSPAAAQALHSWNSMAARVSRLDCKTTSLSGCSVAR